MKIRISRRQDEGIGELLELPEAERQRAKEAISSASIGDLVNMMASEKSIPEPLKKYGNIVNLTASLHSLRASEGAQLDEFLEAVCGAAKAQRPSKETDWPPIKTLLKDLLGVEKIGLAAKAMEILYERPHVSCSSRILTDARPLFKDKADEQPVAMIGTHTLRFTYHEGGQLEEVYVSLDGGDLKALQEQAARALQKEASMKALIEKAGGSFISIR